MFPLIVPSSSNLWHEQKAHEEVPQPAEKCTLGVWKTLGVCRTEVISLRF